MAFTPLRMRSKAMDSREFRIPICATITVAGSHMTVDFTGSAPQVAGNVNAVEAIVRSAAWYCVRLLAHG